MTLIWCYVRKEGSMFAILDLRYSYHVVRWCCYCCNLSFHIVYMNYFSSYNKNCGYEI